MKLAYISQIAVFILLHLSGLFNQINKLIQQSDSGELASVLNLTDMFASPLPLYIFQFLFIVLSATALFIISQAHFSVYLSHKIQNHINNKNHTILLWSVISNIALLIVNSAWFIHSQHLSHWFYTWPAIHLNTYACLIILCAPVIFYIWQTKSNRLTQVCLSACLVLLVAFYASSNNQQQTDLVTNADKPHVIIIGVDSLRSDLLNSHMPYLSEQLKDTVQFEHAYTPLGRTFPAWNSILTGLYPVNHGARINLIDESYLVSSDHYLGSILNREGYKTIFAMDETHFANMGQHQGFEQVISPRMGASDFLIASVADYPITNLLSLLPISSWLLPEIYANRGAATTYRAEAFSELLNREIPAASQPTLLAVHFCLAHWPYRFASKFKPEPNYPQPYYPSNLRAVDLQIKELMADLQNKGYLENSKIIFLSDHGEAWVEESPRFNNIEGENSEYAQHYIREYGHGSSLVSNSSSILLGFKGFQQDALTLNTKKMVSLADITPTILNELNIQDSHAYVKDGYNLLSPNLANSRYMPIETGTVLNLNAEDIIDVEQLMEDLMDRYQLNPSGLIRIRQDKMTEALKAKLKGIRNLDHVLSEHTKNSYRLFDLSRMQFEHFNNFESLHDKHPDWTNAWCIWYQAEDINCKILTSNITAH